MMGERSAREASWQELTKSECFELLARQHVGRVAVVDDQGPVVFPVNYVLDRHTVLFRADAGTKLGGLIASIRDEVEQRGLLSRRRTDEVDGRARLH